MQFFQVIMQFTVFSSIVSTMQVQGSLSKDFPPLCPFLTESSQASLPCILQVMRYVNQLFFHCIPLICFPVSFHSNAHSFSSINQSSEVTQLTLTLTSDEMYTSPS